MKFFSAFTKVSKMAYLVAFITFITRAGQFMSLPFLAIYLSRENILSAGQIGLILGVSGFMLSVTSLFNGMFIDRSSHKKTLVIALFLGGICYLGFAFSMKVFYELLLLNAALGWFRSLADLSAVTILMHNTKQEHLTYAYSARFIGANLGVALGPAIGAIMSIHHSLLIFYIAGALNFGLAIIVLFYNDQTSFQIKQREPLWKNFYDLIKDKTLLYLTLINFLIWVIYAQLDTTFPQYLAATWKNSATIFGVLMTINALICVFFQPLVLRWAELTSLKQSGIIGGIMFAIAFFIFSMHPGFWWMLIAVMLMSFAELFTLPINGLLVMRIAPKHLIASYNGFANLSLLGLSLAPILGGYALQWIGGRNLFLIDASIPIIVVWLYFKYISD
jgi:MFS family permease